MAFTLHPDQIDLVTRCAQAFRDRGRVGVMQGATGFGKTATASSIITSAVEKGKRVVFGAHLDTLVSDTHARLVAAEVHAGFVQAGRPSDPTAPVQVASLGTLHSRGERPPADLLIVDECHRSIAPTIRSILEAYPQTFILGLTATPQRADGSPLGDVYSWMEGGPTVRELQRAGRLVDVDVLAPSEPCDALITEPVAAYQRHTPNGRAIIFCRDVMHATWVTESFRARGLRAVLVTGKTSRPDREAAREALAAGDVNALVSVNVFVEGWDCPATDTVILARDFGHVGSFLQAIGRGLRPHRGKTRCTVIDLRGAVNLLGLPDEDRVWSLTGKPKRTERLNALRRCVACAAIFRPAAVCPRCGARALAGAETSLPRVLTRDEKLERLSHLTQAQRDERYFHSMFHVAKNRMRLSPERANAVARSKFKKQFGRPYIPTEKATKGAA